MTHELKKERHWLRSMIPVAVILVAFGVFRSWQMSGIHHEGPLPEFSGTTVQGEQFSTSDLHGAPALVHFWATWCPVCRMETGTIDSLAQDNQVITIAFEDVPDEHIRSFLAKKGVSFPVIVDRDGSLAHRFGIRGVPTSFFVDANGNVRTAEMGYTTSLGMRLRLWWAGRGG